MPKKHHPPGYKHRSSSSSSSSSSGHGHNSVKKEMKRQKKLAKKMAKHGGYGYPPHGVHSSGAHGFQQPVQHGHMGVGYAAGTYPPNMPHGTVYPPGPTNYSPGVSYPQPAGVYPSAGVPYSNPIQPGVCNPVPLSYPGVPAAGLNYPNAPSMPGTYPNITHPPQYGAGGYNPGAPYGNYPH